jgi:putative hemolysin
VDSWLIIVITLVACSFFAGIEIAFVSANKLRIELENKNGVLSARILSFFLKHPGRFIVAMLLGSNIALVVYGIQMAELIEAPLAGLLHPLAKYISEGNIGILVIFLQTVFSTLLILIIAEFIPKALFRINPNGVLSLFAIPITFFYALLYPIVFITMGIAEFVLKRGFKIEFSEDKPVFGRIDLDNYVREHTSKINSKEDIEHEIQIFQNALEFSEVKARDCMVPRTQIEGIDVSEPIEELHKKFIDTGLSKILIYHESIDHIIGYAHSFALFNNPETIRKVLMPIIIIPETLAANHLLTRFIQERKSLAVVVDEFGGTSGIITIEDVMEEIFGEISDEHDVEELTDRKISENEFLLSGQVKVDYLNDKYKLNIGEGENYETLAGFILNHHEDIPQPDEEIIIGDFKFIISKVLGNKIEEVKLFINKEE